MDSHKALNHSISLTFFLVLVAVTLSFAQSDELTPIEGPSTQMYKEFKIEIVSLRRMSKYRAYFPGTNHPRGRDLVPPRHHEVILIKVRTTRLVQIIGPLTGLSVDGVDLISGDGETIAGNLSRFIGNAKTRQDEPIEIEYEFPIVAPTAKQFRFVQIRHSIQREIQPYVVIQAIKFAISDLAQ
jgi:hypothetical protein